MHRAQVGQTTVSVKAFFGAAESKGFAQGQYPLVCVRLLDKKVLSEARQRTGLSKETAEVAFLDLIRGDATKLVRLR